MLSSQIEQPLAEQSVVLLQVLYQVGLLLHHFLQIGTLSVMKKNTFELCSIAGSTSNKVLRQTERRILEIDVCSQRSANCMLRL